MSSEQEFKCVFCSETFENKETLQVHFRKHADPNFKTSQSEEINPTQRSEQVEMVECDVCPEVFTSISKAITHKHKFHPDHDAKYFCPWCGKLFTMKHLYNKHMHTNHLDLEKKDVKQFPCDCCNVIFNVPAAMLYHNKFFHRQDTDLPCIGTSKKLKIFNQEVVLIYYCSFCGEEYENKVNLHKHIGEDHCDENRRPDDVLRCPLCDAVFYHLDAYELHLTHHTVDDMYSERNELTDQITDFSLESVPPIAEKVETIEEAGDAIGIEQLLELEMDESREKKSKKHKKHKKSKKSAITLDEFFSMNKDVLGEEIDFQGVEEVPTRVVTKKLKAKKPPPVAKLQNSPDIAKLMKQGIVVKKKSGMRPVLKNPPKKSSQNLNAIKKANEKTNNNPDSSSSADALSKLLNQSNTQLKIVRKSNNSETTEQKVEKNPNEEKLTTPSAKEDVKCDEIETNEDNEKEVETELEKEHITETSPNHNLKQPLESSNSKDIPTDNIQSSEAQVTEKSNSADPLKLLKNNTNLVIKSNKPNVVQNNQHIKLLSKKIERYVEETDDNDDEHEIEHGNSKTTTNSSLNVLKHLNHLTVKSNSQHKTSPVCKIDNKLSDVKKAIIEQNKQQLNTNKSRNEPIPLPYYNDKDNMEDDNKEIEYNERRLIAEVQKTQENKLASILNNPHLSIQTKSSPIASPMKESPKENSVNRTSPASFDLLKHLKNVTAKPLNKNSNVRTPQMSPNIKKEPKSPPAAKIIEQNIEIFNIDDSDTDEEHKGPKKTEVKQDQSVNNIKLLNKNITIKSLSQNTNNIKKVVPKITKETVFEDDDPNTDDLDHDSFEKPNIIPINKPIQKVIPNALKFLSKNITIKSSNLSPQTIKRQSQHLKDFHVSSNDDEDDEDLQNNRIKITEIENMSDEEPTEDMNTNSTQPNNVKVHHPDDSESEHDNEIVDNEFDDQFFPDEDIEAQINSVKVMKSQPINSIPNRNLNTLKKLSKDITIKSSNDTPNESVMNAPADDIPPFAKSLSNQISIKNMRGNNRQENLNTVNNPTNIQKAVVRQANQSINQKMMSNQVNTKEVKTVKRFQTQTETVIEEITTTVTKTIKTVNQTMKQETRQESGQCSTTQTVQRFPNQFQKNYQGVKVRQAPPAGAQRIRNFVPPVRVPCNVRAANQTTSIRPQFNTPRPIRPRLAGPKSMMRPPRPPPTPNQKQSCKTVALPKPTPKRLNTEDTAHFSCFKKQKESLIPVDDLPMSNNMHEPTVQYAKSVQMNKSNYTCTTSAVKGDSMITSTQTRSEMSASSQHLSKLKNMSGLSIVKTSQVKQAHVEEKSEMSSSQKNTLDAIMRLQSQGLLIKKPRINVGEDNEGVSDDAGHDSNDGYDDE